ncbi:MAG: ABC transporter substrate-binding protein [Nitrospinaceae bacterium]|nr:ABC transporter substrate-binding protein [Nitrospinaceae bacterium]
MIRERLRLSFLVVVFMVILAWDPVFAVASQVTEDVKDTIDKVIKIVGREDLKDNQEARRQALREVIDQRFNYHQMVRRALAKNWRDRSDQERREFTGLFKKLLENSYASKLESYSDETINYTDEVIKGRYALVKTEVVRKANTIAVDYKLINGDGVWKIYDFVIEGVSMVRNYRSQFSKIIRKDSYEALVRRLTEKVNDLEKDAQKTTPEKL